jgi:hypothetical protein
MASDPGKMCRALKWLISRGPDRTSALDPVAMTFAAAPSERVTELLETLVSLGQAWQTAEGRFAARQSVNLRGLSDLRLA